ncbi:hypothetical protein Q3G72_013418 [Acer saccharum]|nr:hypothetical protein Q3G72_013418 [Acer saccharum]
MSIVKNRPASSWTNGITLVSPGAVPQIDAHHTIQMAEIEIDLQSTQAPQNQLMNRTPPELNLPIPDLLPRQMDTMVVGLAGGGVPQIGSHDPVLTAESTDGHFTQAPQNHNHAPNYQINLPDHSLLPSKCKNQDQYRLKCVPLQKATLTGNLEEAMPLLGDNPRSMLRIAITEWEETVLHIATGAKQVAFVEEIIELMKLDDLKLQDLNGSTAFCFAAAAGSIEITKLMLDKNLDLLTSYLTIVYFLANSTYTGKNQDQYRLKCVPLQKATLTGNLEEAMPLLGDNPRSMLRTAITEWEETVLHIATGAKQVAFVEEIIELMKLDDLKLQDLNGSTTFCFAAAAGSIEIAKLMLDKNLDLLTSYLTIVYFLANCLISKYYYSTYTGKNQDQYRLKCVPLQKATLTGNLEETMPLLGDNPRSMLRTAITEWEETVLHIATGAKQVAFVEEIIELMKLDDLKLQDLNGSTAFCFAAAAGSIEITKLMLDKNLDLLTSYLTIVYFLANCLISKYYYSTYTGKNQDQYRLKCVPLQKATLTGNLEEAMPLLGDNPRSMLRTAITEWEETVLHIATGAKQVAFVEEIIELMKLDDLKLQDLNGSTAFCFVAAAGSIEIAKLMLDKNLDLLTLRGAKNMLPLYMAALFGRMEMVNFLYDGTESHLTPQNEADLFFKSINTDMYDMASKLLQHQPQLAVTPDMHQNTTLHVLARKPSSMFARRRTGLFKMITNSIQEMKFTHNWELMMSSQALELVKCLERAIDAQKMDVGELISKPSNLLFDAAKSGNFEFLAELVRSYPDLVHLLDEQE